MGERGDLGVLSRGDVERALVAQHLMPDWHELQKIRVGGLLGLDADGLNELISQAKDCLHSL